jgi:hypothetical protein
VRIPRGDSVVEMRYAPSSIRIGAALSAACLAAAVLCAWRLRA